LFYCVRLCLDGFRSRHLVLGSFHRTDKVLLPLSIVGYQALANIGINPNDFVFGSTAKTVE
jgi:hypothetical protein